MEEVLDSLGLDRVAMLGMSLGGYVVLKCGAVIPERLSRVALLVPEGLCRSRFLPLFRSVMWPLLRYRLSPSETNLRRFVASLCSPGVVLEGVVEQMGRVMKHVDVGVNLGPLFSAEDLAGLEAPVLVVAGGRDVLYPGAHMVRRAEEVIRSLRDVILLPDANHISIELVSGPAMERVRAFLAEDAV
jgi:pimeloyl-ACP methyl ester carboxylesterase